MKVAVDTNVLLRAVVQDDKKQSAVAVELLENAEAIVLSLPMLCEFVWVLRGSYAFRAQEVVEAIEALLAAKNVVVNYPAIEAGLAVMRAGGDFADGVIAFDGNWMGGESFASFDRKAINLVSKLGMEAQLLS